MSVMESNSLLMSETPLGEDLRMRVLRTFTEIRRDRQSAPLPAEGLSIDDFIGTPIE
jgi:hypothetical protein